MPVFPLGYYIYITLKYNLCLGHPIVYHLENQWEVCHMIYLFIYLFIVLSVLVFLLFSVFNFAILLLGETSHYVEDAQSKALKAVSHNRVLCCVFM
jgi:hypothetical protein